LLEKISDFLECENLNIKFSSEDEHKLIVSGELPFDQAKYIDEKVKEFYRASS